MAVRMTYIFWSNKVFHAIVSFECLSPLSLNGEVGGPKHQILHIQVTDLVYKVLNYFTGKVESSGPEQCCREHSSVFVSITIHDTCIQVQVLHCHYLSFCHFGATVTQQPLCFNLSISLL